MAKKSEQKCAVKAKKDTGVDEILPCLYLSNRYKASSKHILEAVSHSIFVFSIPQKCSSSHVCVVK